MLKKQHRLSRTAFNQVFQIGRRVHSPVATAILTPGDQLQASVVVGKKVHKQAVDRNRLRRGVYALLEQSLPPSYTGKIILILKPAARTLSRRELRVQLQDFLARILNPR